MGIRSLSLRLSLYRINEPRSPYVQVTSLCPGRSPGRARRKGFHPTWSRPGSGEGIRTRPESGLQDGPVYAAIDLQFINGDIQGDDTLRFCFLPQWTMIATMNAHRSDACGTTHDGYVYVTGGFSGSECLGTAERYDPTVDQWSLISPMKCRRSGVGCVGFRDYVYAVGGFNGTSRLSSAEKYNPETNIWTPLTNMYTQRSNLAVCVSRRSLRYQGF